MITHGPDLDQQLRSLGEELDRRSRAHTAAPADTQHRSRMPMLIAAGLVAVAVTGLAIISNVRSSNDDVLPPATQPPITAAVTAPVSPDVLAGTQDCFDSLDRVVNSDVPAEVAARLDWPNPAEARVLVFDVPNEPSDVRVLIVDDNAGYTCKFHRDADANANANASIQGVFVGSTPGSVAPQPDAGQIHIVDVSGTSINLGVGPGTTLYVGRSGPDVVDVAAVLSNGERQPGVITDGWFVIDVDVPADVELNTDDRIAWTTDTGVEHSARFDLLDAVTPAETCASEPNCVQRRIDELIAAAHDNPAQAATLADRVVTDEERRTHQQAFVDCLVAAGIDAEITPNGKGHVITQGAPDGTAADGSDALTAQLECGAEHTEYVAEAYDLLDAESRLNEG
jgi:hypothetical protein